MWWKPFAGEVCIKGTHEKLNSVEKFSSVEKSNKKCNDPLANMQEAHLGQGSAR